MLGIEFVFNLHKLMYKPVHQNSGSSYVAFGCLSTPLNIVFI